MNLLALRIGRNHNYWVDSVNDFFDAAPKARAIYNINPGPPSRSEGPVARGALSFFANSLFNYEMGAGAPVPGSAFSSFFYYSNSYGLYFFLPITRTLFFNAPFVGLLGNLFQSFFSTRITYNKYFILPHSDIDYLINLFVFRFRHKKSFSNTLDLLQSGPGPTLFRSLPPPSGGELRASEPPFGKRARPPSGASEQPMVAGSAGLRQPTARGGWRLTGVNGLKIVCNGRLNLRSLYNSPTQSVRGIGGSNARSKSFEWKWGHIPNNSSTSLDIPINFRYKPFFTQKGSNSLKLLISYKRGA